MDRRFEDYRQAAARGAQWLLAQQNADGSFINEDLQADVYHKGAMALTFAGHPIEANRLLNWIKANDLDVDGRLHHFSPGLAIYKTSWICQGAHRLARFDISRPVIEYILRCQAPCGGFYQVIEGNPYVEPTGSSWAATACIYHGYLEQAARTADYLLSLLEQQPLKGSFYYHATPDGVLATPDDPIDGDAPLLDPAQPGQAYYVTGIAQLFLARLSMATGEGRFLTTSQRYFELSLGFADDAYASPPAGKSAVGAATLYALTGYQTAYEKACEFGDYLLAEQKPEGYWINPDSDNMIVRLDHTAEFIVWLSEIASILGATQEA